MTKGLNALPRHICIQCQQTRQEIDCLLIGSSESTGSCERPIKHDNGFADCYFPHQQHLRDFALQSVDKNANQITPDDYLQQCLRNRRS